MTDTPTTPPRIAMPDSVDELTPEQREAIARFAVEVSHAVQAMIDAFNAFAVACVEAQRRMDELHAEWQRANGIDPDAPDLIEFGNFPS